MARTMPKGLSRAALFRMLDARLDDPSRAAADDRAIWRTCGGSRAILVVDLSGFTRITRKRGILHFLSVYRRAVRIAVPCFARHGGRILKREADNLIVSFSTVPRAVAAARALVSRAAEVSRALPEDDRPVPCIGIGYGRILELTDDAFGDEVNVAFKIGEDLAKASEILVSEAAFSRLRGVTGVRHEVPIAGTKLCYFVLAPLKEGPDRGGSTTRSARAAPKRRARARR